MIKSNVTDRRPRSEKFRRTIKLVSGGYACPTAFPDGNIVVLPWDSTIDRWLSEASSTATGNAREKVMFDLMAKLCVLGPCPLEDFVIGDMNTVLLVARAISEMNEVEYLTVCPHCGEKEVDTITVPEELKPIGQKAPDYKGYDTVTLDISKDAVDVRPLRIRDSLAIAGRAPEAKAVIDDHLAYILAPIVNVGGSPPDRIEELKEWYLSIHPADAKQLEEFADNNTPHLSQTVAQQCSSCKKIYPHRLVLDQDFFRSGRMGTAGESLAANL